MSDVDRPEFEWKERLENDSDASGCDTDGNCGKRPKD
jgi:hypothetical protein